MKITININNRINATTVRRANYLYFLLFLIIIIGHYYGYQCSKKRSKIPKYGGSILFITTER